MTYLVYISTAKRLFKEEELLELLLIARKKNEENHVTGMLLYNEGTFIQALEGAEEDVNKIYDSIKLDQRHKNIITMGTGPSEIRMFPHWSMGFSSINKELLNEIEGYLNPSNKNFASEKNHNMITMLKTFAETNNIPISI